MKKILSFLFVGLLLFLLVGCTLGGETKTYSVAIQDGDSNVTLEVGGTKQITATYEGGTLEWLSSDDSVVSVTNGLLTALKAGNATVTVRLKEHTETSVTITVTVKEKAPEIIEVTGIALAGKKTEVEVGDEFTLTATVTPTNATDKTVTWASSDATVATVVNGKVTALKAGTTEISATAGGKTDKFTLTVSVPEPAELYLYHNKESMFVGETDELDFGIDPEEASQEVEWSFDEEGIVRIDEAGVLTALKSGLVTITLTCKEDPTLTQSYKLRVLDNFTVPEAKDTETVPGKTIELKPIIAGNDPNLTFTYTSSDEAVATVTAAGVITTVAAGKTTITITSSDPMNTAISFELTIINSFIKIGDETIEVTDGQVLKLESKTYDAEVVVCASNVTLQGNNTTFTKHVQLADGLENVKFVGITFTQNAYIDTPQGGSAAVLPNAIGLKGITFDKCVFDKISSMNDGSVQFFVPCEDFTFTNCDAQFSSNRGIRFEGTIHNLTVDNCKFVNTSSHWDTLRGMDLVDGDVTITNCVFENTLQSLIQFRYIGAGNYTILSNTFKNAACTSIDTREIKDAAFEGKAVFNIKFNTFDGGDNDWGTIRLRNLPVGGTDTTVADKVEANINYNKFINIEFDADTTYYINKPANTAPGKWNLDYNYSDKGELQLSWLSEMQSSAENWFTSEEAFDNELPNAKINGDDSILVVGTRDGITKTSYESLAAALAAAKEGNTILLLPGAYTGDAKISINNLTITSLNGDFIPGQLVTRFDEATYDGKLTLAKELKGLTIKGIKFIGTSQILNEKGEAGTAQATTTNLDGFNFINNLVESAATGNGFIFFVEGSSCYSHDVNISNNRFKAATGFSAKAMIWLDNNYNLVACDNLFEDMTVEKAAFYVNDETKGLSGEFSTLNNNIFKNITGSGLWINWLSALPLNTDTCVVSIQNNTFENVSEYGIYLGKMNNSDKYAAIKVMFNSFKNVKNCLHFLRVTKDSNVEAKYNKFLSVPTGLYANNDSANQSTSGGVALDLTECLYLDGETLVTPAAAKFAGEITYTTTITDEGDLPGFDSKATAIKIKDVELFVGDEYQMVVTYTPKNTTNTGVEWKSSDATIATVSAKGVVKALKAGTVTITATYLMNAEVTDSITLEIKEFQEVELYVEGNGYLKPQDQLDITAEIVGSVTTGEIEWSTSDATIATVENGKVTAVAAGKVTITAAIKNTELSTSIVLEVNELSEMDELLKLLVSGHRAVVENQTINYIGYESGYEKVPHQVYTSVNSYYAAAMPEIKQNRNDHVMENTSGTMKSVEFIVVHDTGAAGPTSTAKANSDWALNLTNTSTSYHYVVGNDGIYQQLDDNIIAWHAGDGKSWQDDKTVHFHDTGVEADADLRNRAVVTLSDDGFFVVNGTKTNIPLPTGATAANGTNRLGLGTIVKDGHYYIPDTWVSPTYDNKICIGGGGLNGIGIESAVNTGSDVYLTWQNLAKLVASLLVKHNLTPDRVMFHNNFSNKTCPNTMINSDNIDMFLDMCYMEYYILKNYSDYTITFTSNNPDVIDNTGRVIGVGPYKATNVSYTITITKGEETKSVTLYSLVQGSHKH